MGLYRLDAGDFCGLPCGLNLNVEADCLFDGVAREEKLALRRAERAGRRFRASKGYEPDTLWSKLGKYFWKIA